MRVGQDRSSPCLVPSSPLCQALAARLDTIGWAGLPLVLSILLVGAVAVYPTFCPAEF